MSNNPFASLQRTFGNAVNIATNLKKTVDTVREFADNPLGFMKGIRSINLPADAMPTFKRSTTAVVNSPRGDNDWRVSLSVPPIMQEMDSTMLGPLYRTGKKFIFPFTPSIIFSHSASYNALQPIHTNYPFYNYQSSAVDAITIAGDFFVETSQDAEYWVSGLTYLRTVTKMFYGSGANVGNPPPIVKLNGYGDYVFNNVPCVITAFNIDLPQDVDYLKTAFGSTQSISQTQQEQADNVTTQSGPGTWVPAQSLISVTVQPVYSRSTQAEFNLNNFVNGDLITKGMI